MKGAKSQVVGTSFLKLYKSSNYINDVYPGKNLLYGVLRDQKISWGGKLPKSREFSTTHAL